MNKIKWYRDSIYKEYCYVEINNIFYAINVFKTIVFCREPKIYIDEVDEKEISDLDEYKILRRHLFKLTSNLYQELIK